MSAERIKQRLDDDRGFGLVELLVVMVLLGIVGAILVASMVSGMRTTSYGQQRVESIANAQVGMERMARELRAADPLRVAEPDQAAADVRRAGVLHHYIYRAEDTGGQIDIVEERWTFQDPAVFDAPDFDPYSETPDESTERTLVWDIEASTVFEYRDHAGDPPATVGAVRRIVIEVIREVQADRSPVRVKTSVKVRNAS